MVKQTLEERATRKTPNRIKASNVKTPAPRSNKLNTISTLRRHMWKIFLFGQIQNSPIKDKTTTISIIFLLNKGQQSPRERKDVHPSKKQGHFSLGNLLISDTCCTRIEHLLYTYWTLVSTNAQ